MFSPCSDINLCYSLFFDRDHLPSNMGIISGLGIVCGRGSFAVGDHLRCCTGRQNCNIAKLQNFERTFRNKWIIIFLTRQKEGTYGFVNLYLEV